MLYRLLFLFLLFVNTGFAQKRSVPVIDKNPIKVSDLLWDLDKLSIPPEVEWTSRDGAVHSLLYRSVDYKGSPTQVFVWYSNPDLLMGRPFSGKQFPGIVLVHGGGGKAFKEWVQKWAADGYAAIAMDLSGNGPEGKKIEHPGPEQSRYNKFEIIETGNLKDVWTYHAVASVVLAHSLLLSLPEVDTTKTSITGISWGGYLTEIAASLDNRFKAAAPVYGCGYYDESDTFSRPLGRLSPGMRQKWMTYFDPSAYLLFAKPAFLFINGNKDRHYNVVPYHKTYSLIPDRQRIICIKPDMKHSHPWGWKPQEIRYFFESVVNEGAPLITVGEVKVKKGVASLPYKSPVGLFQAKFYYSNDTTSTNEQRIWKVQRARIDEEAGIVSCPVPKEGFKYAFFYLKDQRHLTVSSEFIIK